MSPRSSQHLKAHHSPAIGAVGRGGADGTSGQPLHRTGGGAGGAAALEKAPQVGEVIPLRQQQRCLPGGEGISGAQPLKQGLLRLDTGGGGPQVAQLELELPPAPVFVNLRGEHHVHPSPGEMPAAALLAEKKMASKVWPSRRSFIFRWRPPPTSAQDTTCIRCKRSTGLGVAGAERLQQGQFIYLTAGEQSTVVDVRVHIQHSGHGVMIGIVRHQPVHGGVESGDVLFQNGKARSQLMTAVFLQQRRAGVQGGK